MIRVGRAFKVKEISLSMRRKHIQVPPWCEKYLATSFNFEGIVDGRRSNPVDVDMLYLVSLLRMMEYGIRPEEFAFNRLSTALSDVRQDFIYTLREAVAARKEKLLHTSAYDPRERQERREKTWHYGNTHRSFKEEMKRPR